MESLREGPELTVLRTETTLTILPMKKAYHTA